MKTLLKGSLVVLAVCAIQSAYAHEASFKDGVYVAGSIGARWTEFEWDGQGVSSALDAEPELLVTDIYSLSGNKNDTQFAGSVAAGYQVVDKRLYLGFEVAGTFGANNESIASRETPFEVNDFDDDGDTTMSGIFNTGAKVTLDGSEFDIDLKPGYLITRNFLVYGRVGAAFNKLEMQSSGYWYEKNNWGSYTYTEDSDKQSENVVGIRLGLGLEYLFNEHLGVTADYLYTYYGTIDSTLSGIETYYSEGEYDLHASSGFNFSEVKVYTQTAMLGLAYHF